MSLKQGLVTGGNRAGQWSWRVATALAGTTAAVLTLVGPAAAAPLWPGGPELPSIQEIFSGSSGQAPTAPPAPVVAPFSAPSVNPTSGETVGVAQPIIIRFNEAIGDRAAAERAISITTSPRVDGHFYWASDRQVRWRPFEFWPAHTQVTVAAGDTHSSFTIGDAQITVADDNTKTITVTRNGEVVRTMPTSFGKPGHETPNGTYIVGERFRDMYMDSSTYGVPVDSPEGYRTYVEYATRISNSGIFVHAAPWSVWAQGNTNVSHGCLNLNSDNAEWFYNFSVPGDVVEVRNTGGPGLQVWQNGDWSLPWDQWRKGSALP